MRIVYNISFGDEDEDVMPSCSCLDWRVSAFPCKHFFAIMQKYPEDWGWEELPESYRCSPFLTLDFNDAGDGNMSNIEAMAGMCTDIRILRSMLLLFLNLFIKMLAIISRGGTADKIPWYKLYIETKI